MNNQSVSQLSLDNPDGHRSCASNRADVSWPARDAEGLDYRG